MKKILLMTLLLATIAGTVQAGHPAPNRKNRMTIAELQTCIFDNDGEVIEVEANWFTNLKQTAPNKYRVYCNYHDDDNWSGSGSTIHFEGDDARDFFKDLVEENDGYWDSGSDEKFYVYVEGKKLTAISRKYSKSKKLYGW